MSVLVLLVYSRCLNNGYTELDDTIFVNEFHAYNSQPENLLHSFRRGVFNENKDIYYRPMLLNSFIVNTFLSEEDLKAFFLFNIVLHLLSVIFLFYVFRKLKVDSVIAFLLAAVFAVHPALTQAVAWIPGRNDTLLALFGFSSLWCLLHYREVHKPVFLILHVFTLLLALFTKETAIMWAPVYFMLLVVVFGASWKDRKMLLYYGVWTGAYLLWFLVRSMATLKSNPVWEGNVLMKIIARIPVALQYFGKAVLPVNLSVFPMQDQTSYIPGIVALVLFIILLFLSKGAQRSYWWAGFAWFILMLTPLFLLPASINDQDFEHRMYNALPGLLLVLPETWLFRNKPLRTYLIAGLLLIGLFSFQTYRQQGYFSDPKTFWEEAVKSSPQSAYANMMLAARLDSTETARAKTLMHKAYSLNPKERYVNYYLGKQALEENKLPEAKKYLQEELKGSAYYDTWFLLSRLCFMENDTLGSISYMEQYLKIDPKNPQAINNLALMWIDHGEKQKAFRFLSEKRAAGVVISEQLYRLSQ
ncbi:MAG TPA: hypothetical protein PLP14_01165 [Chitinophagaceae bacterium]|nr:hypothetical protein [Chitinophagaceae bacterium]